MMIAIAVIIYLHGLWAVVSILRHERALKWNGVIDFIGSALVLSVWPLMLWGGLIYGKVNKHKRKNIGVHYKGHGR